jgi:putative endopeptidase
MPPLTSSKHARRSRRKMILKSAGKTHRRRRIVHEAADAPSIPIAPQNIDVTEKIDPGDNFYAYVNAEWQSHIHIPSFETDFGVSEEVEQIVEKQLQTILTTSMSIVDESKREGSSPNNRRHEMYTVLGKIGKSALNKGAQKNSVEQIRSMCSSLGCIRTVEDVTRTIAEYIQYGISTLFYCRVTLHTEKKDVYHLCLEPDFSGIYYAYYDTKQPGNPSILKAYEQFLKKIGKEFSIPNLHAVIPFESYLIDPYLNADNEELKSIQGYKLEKKIPGFPWDVFFDTLGVKGWRNQRLYVRSYGWFRMIQRFLKSISIEEWIRYFRKSLLVTMIQYLPPPYDDIDFEFFGKRLQGQAKKVPQDYLTVSILKKYCSDIVSRIYSEDYVSDELIEQSKKLSKRIREAACRRAGLTDWLLPDTRKRAMEKINHIKMGLCHWMNT